MYGKFIFSRNGLMFFLLMWSISICNVTCGLCPVAFNGGFIDPFCSRLSGDLCTFYCSPGFVKIGSSLTCGNDGNWIQDINSVCIKPDFCPAVFNGGYIEPSCSRLVGVWCSYYCNPGLTKKLGLLFCWNDGNWIPDSNSMCIKSVETNGESSLTQEGKTGIIIGVISAFLIVMMAIIALVLWKSKRSCLRKSKARVRGHAGGRCLRPREIPDHNVTTRRQQPNADGIDRVSSFEFPLYNGLYVHSFVQRIPTISSNFKYLESPPSYSETQIATDESPPTYKEVVTNPRSFGIYI